MFFYKLKSFFCFLRKRKFFLVQQPFGNDIWVIYKMIRIKNDEVTNYDKEKNDTRSLGLSDTGMVK